MCATSAPALVVDRFPLLPHEPLCLLLGRASGGVERAEAQRCGSPGARAELRGPGADAAGEPERVAEHRPGGEEAVEGLGRAVQRYSGLGGPAGPKLSSPTAEATRFQGRCLPQPSSQNTALRGNQHKRPEMHG